MPLPALKSNSFTGNSFYIFIIRFFPSLANLLVLVWYSRYLPPAVYGNYQRFWIQLSVIYPLACFGIHVLIITYPRGLILSLARSIKTRYYIVYALWLLALAGVFALLGYQSLQVAFVLLFLFLPVWAVSQIFESYLIVCRAYRTLVALSVLYAAAFCFFHWLVLRNGFSLQVLFTYIFSLVAARFCIYAAILWGNRRMDVDQDRYTLPGMHSIRSLWLHLGFYDSVQMLFSWIDKFIVALVLSAPLSALYFNGSQTIPFLPLLLSAAGSAVLMQIATHRQTDETSSLLSYMRQSGRILSCIVFPLFFFLMFFRHEVIGILLPRYMQALPVFAVSLLVLPVKSYSFTTVLQRLHNGKLINIGSVADLLLACALMYPLYLWLGLPGIALSFVVSTYLQAAFYLICAARLLHVRVRSLIPYINWLVKFIVFGVLFIIIHYVVHLYFTEKIVLILGGVMMVVMIAVSLFLEYLKQSKYGRS